MSGQWHMEGHAVGANWSLSLARGSVKAGYRC